MWMQRRLWSQWKLSWFVYGRVFVPWHQFGHVTFGYSASGGDFVVLISCKVPAGRLSRYPWKRFVDKIGVDIC